MAFSRSFLKSTGLTDEQITAVMEEHVTVVDGLKKDRDTYKEQADKAADLQKQLEEMQSGEDWQKKFEKEHKDFEDFKKQTAEEAEAAKVRSAFRKLLAEESISEKRLDSILKVTDLSGMKVGENGKLEDEDKIRETVNKEWSEFKTTVTERGAVVEKPPQTDKPTKTREEILAIKDTSERQKAIAENLKLFGKG